MSSFCNHFAGNDYRHYPSWRRITTWYTVFKVQVKATLLPGTQRPLRALFRHGSRRDYRIFTDCHWKQVSVSIIKMLCPSSLLRGDGEIRTHDPLLARQVLSQLSYTPIQILKESGNTKY